MSKTETALEILEIIVVILLLMVMAAFGTAGAAVMWRVIWWTWPGMMIILP